VRVVLDTNIIIDALRPNTEFESDAKKIFLLIWQGKIEPFICANSLTDIFYVLRKTQSAEKSKEAIGHLIKIVNILTISESECSRALALPMSDFEDALIAVCALNIKADCIVSRDTGFINAKVATPVITPQQLITRIDGESP